MDFDTNNDFASLQMLVEAGCSDVVQASPRGWLRPSEIEVAAEVHPVKPASARPAKPVAPAQSLDHITTLAELRAAIDAFEGCALKTTATNTVFADGPAESRVMLIGEAPGADEDRQGLPFVGEAGHLLNRMLSAAAMDRANVYITNMIFWRPPGNRTPTVEEILQCLPFVQKHIQLVNPQAILALGNVPSKTLLNTDEGITRLRGKWANISVNGTSYPLLPTFHPAYLLRQPAHKAMSWADLLNFKTVLDGRHAH